MDFKATVSVSLQQIPELRHLPANKFEVAVTTPDRWASGVAVPHPNQQQRILEFIQQHLKGSISELNLSAIPELKALTIIRSQGELIAFLGKLRQDYYSPAQIQDLKLDSDLAMWLASRHPNFETFFAVHDEADSRQNDDWGHHELFRCIAMRSSDGNIHVLKSSIKKFSH